MNEDIKSQINAIADRLWAEGRIPTDRAINDGRKGGGNENAEGLREWFIEHPGVPRARGGAKGSSLQAAAIKLLQGLREENHEEVESGLAQAKEDVRVATEHNHVTQSFLNQERERRIQLERLLDEQRAVAAELSAKVAQVEIKRDEVAARLRERALEVSRLEGQIASTTQQLNDAAARAARIEAVNDDLSKRVEELHVQLQAALRDKECTVQQMSDLCALISRSGIVLKPGPMAASEEKT